MKLVNGGLLNSIYIRLLLLAINTLTATWPPAGHTERSRRPDLSLRNGQLQLGVRFMYCMMLIIFLFISVQEESSWGLLRLWSSTNQRYLTLNLHNIFNGEKSNNNNSQSSATKTPITANNILSNSCANVSNSANTPHSSNQSQRSLDSDRPLSTVPRRQPNNIQPKYFTNEHSSPVTKSQKRKPIKADNRMLAKSRKWKE